MSGGGPGRLRRLPLALGLLFLAVLFRDLWRRDSVFALSNDDNFHYVYPMFRFFFQELKRGHLAVWNPYLWGGLPLVGSPNLALTPLHWAAGLLLGDKGLLYFLSLFSFAELCAAFAGFYCFARRRWPGERPLLSLWAASLYLFSSGVFVSYAFFSTSFHFAVIPWVFYILQTASERRQGRNAALLAAVFCLQLLYGQLQFTLYGAWLFAAFALWGAEPRGRRLRMSALVLGFSCAALLSAAHLLPLLDSLRVLASGEPRLSGPFDPARQMVPLFYLARLLYPTVLSSGYPLSFIDPRVGDIPWWPLWRDGWSTWESFSSYQGIAAALMAVYGLLFLKGHRFWKAGVVGILACVSTAPGVTLLRVLHFGMDVPYGRMTVLLNVFTTVLVIETARSILEDAQARRRFALWLSLSFAALFVLAHSAAPELWAKAAFAKAGAAEAAQAFLAAHGRALRFALACHNGLLGAGAALACALAFTRRRGAALVLLALVNLFDAAVYIQGFRGRSRAPLRELGIFKPYPLEEALLRDHPDLSRYRVHLDIPFGYQRDSVLRTQSLTSAAGSENSFRLLPNATMLGGLPITTGYSNLVPASRTMANLMFWGPARRGVFRHVDDVTALHPGLLELFSVAYVLRHADIPYSGPQNPAFKDCGDYFLKHSVLLGESDRLRLYKLDGPTPRFYFPRRLAWRRDTVGAFTERGCGEGLKRSFGVINEDDPAKDGGQEGRVLAVRETTADDVTIAYEAPKTAYLVAGISFHPWWTASQGGRDLKIHRANGIFSAVEVAPGKGEVRFQCRPLSVRLGFALSLASAAVFAYLVLFTRLRRISRGRA